jgi:hypothetical protein
LKQLKTELDAEIKGKGWVFANRQAGAKQTPQAPAFYKL